MIERKKKRFSKIKIIKSELFYLQSIHAIHDIAYIQKFNFVNSQIVEQAKKRLRIAKKRYGFTKRLSNAK